MNNKLNIPQSWHDYIPKYKDDQFMKKKLPLFYEFYQINDFDNVYEPAEDTFLFVDTLELEYKENLVYNLSSSILSSEIGCGSSFISINFLEILSKENKVEVVKHYCFDINQSCIDLSNRLINKLNYTKEKAFAEKCYFFNKSYFLSDKYKDLDKIFIFNPPYVTTDKYELNQALEEKNIVASWAGGENGSEVIYDFIDYFKVFLEEYSILSYKGKVILYLLISSENEYNKIFGKLVNISNYLEWNCLSKKIFKNERLGIFKIVYKN